MICLLNDIAIRKLIAQSNIKAEKPIHDTQIQPASLDMRLGDEAFLLHKPMLPQGNISFNTMMDHAQARKVDLNSTADALVLYPDKMCIVKLQENICLPKHIGGKTNPKSSIGRMDVLVRILGNMHHLYDDFPLGYKGHLYAAITTSSFPIRLHKGQCMTQIRFYKKSQKAVQKQQNHHEIHLDIQESSIYQSKKTNTIFDFRQKYDWQQFFHTKALKNKLHLEKGNFYLLSSKETFHILQDYAGNIQPYDTRIGEIRMHYAGFLDPGFQGKIILEVRAHENITIHHEQLIGHILMENMCDKPQRLYGEKALGSSYQKNNGHVTKYLRESSSA